MKHPFTYLLLISCITHGIGAISIDCGELYDDDTLSSVWGYVYYSCNGTIIADRHNSNLTELFGLHKHGKKSRHIERLMLTNQNLTSFPTNLETIFPHLRHIVLSSNSITRLTNSDLKPHKFLLELHLDNNQINSLEKNLFHGTDLLTVNLTSNKIKHIDHDITLPPKARIYLLNNPCIDEQARSEQDISGLLSIIQNQCAPSSNITIPVIDMSENTSLANDSSIFVDRTEEKGPEPITEEPDIDTKPPKMGEFLACTFAVVKGERCKAMLERHRNAQLNNSLANGEPFRNNSTDDQ